MDVTPLDVEREMTRAAGAAPMEDPVFERLGSLSYRYRFLFVGAWIVGAIVCGVFAPSLASQGSADQGSFLPATAPSVAARDALEAAFPGSTSATSATITARRPDGITAADRAYLTALAAWASSSSAPEVLRSAVTGTETATSRPELAPMLRSDDGQLELLVVDLDVGMAGGEAEAVVEALRDHVAATAPSGLETHVTGAAGISADYLAAIQRGTDSTTLVTVVLVLVILLLIYRAPLAALVPLVTIGAAFVVARGVLGFLAAAGWDVSSLLDTFLVVLVFGVGTDYAIFLISRYREEVSHDSDWHDASRATVKRIGAVISASAATVIVGLGAMAFGDFKMIQTTGPALAVAIFVTLCAGLTLAPAMLAIFGHYLFWPRHLRTKAEGEPGGWFALLADVVSRRPGLVTAGLVIGLAIPALYVPQMRTNFDILSELPTDSDARIGYQAIADHLGQDKLVQSTAILDAGPSGDLLAPGSLARVRDIVAQLEATPGVATVTSLVTPKGDGVVPDAFRPSVQLGSIADQLAGDTSAGASDEAPASPAGDSTSLLDPDVEQGLDAALRYVEAIASAYPDVAGRSELTATTGAIADAKAIIDRVREQSRLSTQLRSLADAITAPTATATGGASSTLMTDYLAELASAYPEVRSLPAYRDATKAAASLAKHASIGTALDLSSALDRLAGHFDGRPDATFSSTALAGTDEGRAFREEATATFDRLPIAFRDLAAVFKGRSDDIFVPVGLGGDDGAELDDAVAAFVADDHRAMRFYMTATADPYSGDAFSSIHRAQEVLATSAPGLGVGATGHVGGATAQFLDVQDTLSADFGRVGVITVLGILIVLMILLRAIVAPLYLVGTVLLSYASAVGLSSWLFQEVLGQPGVSFYLPLMVFVLLVALGSDYNIFLMSRVREESEGRPIRDGIRIASGHTGAVITSAGLILAGTFGSMATAPLVVLFQVGVAVAIGVLIDTFIVRSILVPAITTLVGERAWWPSGSRLARWFGTAPVPVPDVPATVPALVAATAETGPRMPARRFAVILILVVTVPAFLAGLLTWSLADPGAGLRSAPAAVVVEDAATTLTTADGTTSPLHLGADIASALADGKTTGTFDWVMTDASTAAAGLADGQYAAVLTIPDDFSTRVATIRADRRGTAQRAVLRLETADATGSGVSDVARDVTAAIAATTAKGITDGYVDDVLLAVAKSHEGITTGAADARDVADRSSGLADDAAAIGAVADQLASGLKRLTSGLDQAGSGTTALAAGTRKLSNGTAKLAVGAKGLATGTATAADGADALDDGAAALASGLGTLDSSTSSLPAQASALADGASGVAEGAAGVASGAKDLASGLEDLATGTAGLGVQASGFDAGASALATGTAALSAGADTAAARAKDLADGASTFQTKVGDYTSAVADLAASCTSLGGSDPLCAQLAGLAATNDQVTGAAAGVSDGATKLAAGLTDQAAGAATAAAGAADLAKGTAVFAKQAPALEDGIASAANGAAKLTAGATSLSTGAASLSKGVAAFAAGAPALADGIGQAHDGAAKLASGTASMAGGLHKLASGADSLATGAALTAKGAAALSSGTASAAAGASQLLDAVDSATEAARLVGVNADRVASSGAALSDDATGLADRLGSTARAMPASSTDSRAAVADLAASPIQVEASASATGAPLEGGLAPVFLAIAWWVGALAIFTVLPARWRQGPRGWRTALALFAGWAALGLIQAVLAIGLLGSVLGVEVKDLVGLLLFGALVAVTFAAIVQAFVAVVGRRGWLLAILLLGLQVAAAGLPGAAASVPAPLAAIQPLLPMSWAIEGIATTATGGGVPLAASVAVLTAWLVLAVLVTLAAAAATGPRRIAHVPSAA